MFSELLSSTSEIQTDVKEAFQLEALSLNYLRNQDISTIPSQRSPRNLIHVIFATRTFSHFDSRHLPHCHVDTYFTGYVLRSILYGQKPSISLSFVSHNH